MLNYQNYLHYKLPITMNPLKFGKLIEQIDNKYIIQLNTINVVVIKEFDNENYIKFFRKGDLIFLFKDNKISENTFVRTILDNKFTFKDNKLISTEILVRNSYYMIYKNISPSSNLNLKNTNNSLLNINSNNRLFHTSTQLSNKFVSLDYQINKQYNNTYKIKLNNV